MADFVAHFGANNIDKTFSKSERPNASYYSLARYVPAYHGAGALRRNSVRRRELVGAEI
jgi:hypothetical protein